MESALGQEFNLASGVETRIVDLAHMVNAATGNSAGVRFVSRRKWDTKPRLLASIDRAHELIGYQPQTSFEEGLDKAVQWFQENWENIETSARFGPGVSSAVRELAANIR